MKQFLAFVKKEFWHILRDRKTLLILFGMPVIQVILFGYVLSNEIKNVPVAILDHSKDYTTTQLINKISSSGYFQIYSVLRSEKEIDQAFKNGKIRLALIFPEKFSASLFHTHKAQIQLVADATDINTAATLTNYATSIIRNFEREQNAGLAIPMQIVSESRMIYNPELKSVYMFIPGVIAIVMMLISAMLTSITIAREKEMGTMEILMISPLHPLQIIVGKVIPYLSLSIINCAIILAMGIFIFGMPLNGSVILLAVECTLYIITSLALGIMISSVANTQQTAMFASILALMMPTMLLSGFIFPTESMPLFLQFVSKVIPANYFIQILKSVMIKGSGIEMVWQPTLILILITTVFLIVSLRKMKPRLD